MKYIYPNYRAVRTAKGDNAVFHLMGAKINTTCCGVDARSVYESINPNAVPEQRRCAHGGCAANYEDLTIYMARMDTVGEGAPHQQLSLLHKENDKATALDRAVPFRTVREALKANANATVMGALVNYLCVDITPAEYDALLAELDQLKVSSGYFEAAFKDSSSSYWHTAKQKHINWKADRTRKLANLRLAHRELIRAKRIALAVGVSEDEIAATALSIAEEMKN